MGEWADSILDGDQCEICGEVFDDGESAGYPRKCDSCLAEEENKNATKSKIPNARKAK